MIANLQKASIGLMFLALCIFFYGYYYRLTITNESYTLSILITKITSFFSTTPHKTSPSFEASGFSMYEDLAVIVLFAVAAVLSTSGAIISIYHRIQYGKTRLFLPILFGSSAITGCIGYVSVNLI